MPTSLQGKIVLITGASSGFGADAARLFAREGAIVFLAARRLDKLTALAEEIRQAGGQAVPLVLDVVDRSQVDQVVKTILDEFGRIDVLFNNAGFGRLKWLETLDIQADIDTQIDVNLRGLIQVARAVLPSMLEHRSGTIINMSSVAGRIAAPMYTIYAATKFGVRGFTDALRREASPFGVRICGIYPGGAATEFSQHTGTAQIKKKVRLPGWLNMTSEHVARRVVRLAKHPRRSVVIPWYFHLAFFFDARFPWLVDWFLKVFFVKRFHKMEPDQ